MRCLRCAGAPRRPATGSALSSPIFSSMSFPASPESPTTAYIQFLRGMRWPSPTGNRLGTLNVTYFGAYCFAIATTCYFASPPYRGHLLPRFQTGRSPFPLVDITTASTGQFPRMRLSLTRSATERRCTARLGSPWCDRSSPLTDPTVRDYRSGFLRSVSLFWPKGVRSADAAADGGVRSARTFPSREAVLASCVQATSSRSFGHPDRTAIDCGSSLGCRSTGSGREVSH
jgi:hypothetical protein